MQIQSRFYTYSSEERQHMASSMGPEAIGRMAGAILLGAFLGGVAFWVSYELVKLWLFHRGYHRVAYFLRWYVVSCI